MSSPCDWRPQDHSVRIVLLAPQKASVSVDVPQSCEATTGIKVPQPTKNPLFACSIIGLFSGHPLVRHPLFRRRLSSHPWAEERP